MKSAAVRQDTQPLLLTKRTSMCPGSSTAGTRAGSSREEGA